MIGDVLTKLLASFLNGIRFRITKTSITTTTANAPDTAQKAQGESVPGIPPTFMPSNPVKKPSGSMMVATTVKIYMVRSMR